MIASNCLTLVHNGFDEENQPEYAEQVKEAIDIVYQKAGWVLLFVNHGEINNSQSIENINKYRIMETIHFFFSILSMQHFGIKIKDENGNYFYNENLMEFIPKEIFWFLIYKIDLSELEEIERQHTIIMNKFRLDFNEEVDKQARLLSERESKFRDSIDFKSLYEEIYALYGGKNLFGLEEEGESIYLGNKNRYKEIYQYAIEKLGAERISEIFINDKENVENELIDVHSNFLSKDSWTLKEIDDIGWDFFGELFNIKLKSRNSKIDEAFIKLGIDKNTTGFYVIGEYLGRCVSNVAEILEERGLTELEVAIIPKYCLLKKGDSFDGKQFIYGN